MKIKYCKVNPTGNITLIVETPVPRESQAAVAALLMEADGTAEQVGFLEKPASPCAPVRLQMMGGEFCGNASISTAAMLAERAGLDRLEISLEVSGIDEGVAVSASKNADGSYTCTVDMPIPEAVYDCTFIDGFEPLTLPLVRFPGICHVIADAHLSPTLASERISGWCRQLRAEALGVMFLDKSRSGMEPLVYVASTDTTVWENSCASGTCAAAAYLAKQKRHSVSVSLRQPGGILSAAAEYRSDDVRSIKLTGKAVIEGKFEIDINT